MIPGRVLYVDGTKAWLARGGRLFYSDNSGHLWREQARLPDDLPARLKVGSRLGRRLFRAGFHHFVPTGHDEGVAIANRSIYRLEPETGKFVHAAPLKGSRPLSVTFEGGRLYYGEYRGNNERSPVHVWASDRFGSRWEPVWTFSGVRHVHGIFHDPFWSGFWVTTGDRDEEAAIWFTDDGFRTLSKVIGGQQRYRVVQPLFDRDYVYFGSDTPDQPNYLYRMRRSDCEIERLQAVGGSVFFGYRAGGRLYFSTAVERSRVNTASSAELWETADGENWRIAAEFPKDIWPMKYFQYGQVMFPGGPGDDRTLWYTPFATKCDQFSIRQRLATAWRQAESGRESAAALDAEADG